MQEPCFAQETDDQHVTIISLLTAGNVEASEGTGTWDAKSNIVPAGIVWLSRWSLPCV